jgi:hypothetical protein
MYGFTALLVHFKVFGWDYSTEQALTVQEHVIIVIVKSDSVKKLNNYYPK